MVPTDLSGAEDSTAPSAEHTAWVRPSLSSTIVVRCSIVVAAPVPLDLTVLPRSCAGSAALGRRARGPDWAPVDPRRRTGQPSRWSERRTVPVAGCERSSGRGRGRGRYGDGLAPSPMEVTGGETWEGRSRLRRVSRPAGRRPQSPVRAGSQHSGAGRGHWPVLRFRASDAPGSSRAPASSWARPTVWTELITGNRIRPTVLPRCGVPGKGLEFTPP